MKIKTEYVVLILIIGALSAYLLVQKRGKVHYTLPELAAIQKKEISKVDIQKEGLHITLTREDDKWLVGTEKFPADPSKVDELLEGIEGLTLTALASESRNYTLYELEDEKRLNVEAYKGADLLRTIHVGKPASSQRHTFVMVNNDHRVFHSEGNLRNKFTRTVSDLRDKTVLSIDEEITGFSLTQGTETLTLAKTTAPVSVDLNEAAEKTEEESGNSAPEEPKIQWVSSVGISAKEEEIEEMTRTLQNLQCDDYLTEMTKEDLTSPIYTVSLNGLKTYTLSIFDKGEEPNYPAVSSENPYPFVITEWKANRIMKDLKSLLEQ